MSDLPMILMESAVRIDEGEVHAWYSDLDRSNAAVASYFALLSSDERERARRFRSEHHRRRFVVARGVLRELAARYTGIDAPAIAFGYSPLGKPSLLNAPFQISASRSGAFGAYAFARVPVGIDIEVLRPLPDAEAITLQHFSLDERCAWYNCAPEHRLETFFRYWTRKEAYVKALGKGLSLPLASFSVYSEATRVVVYPSGEGAPPWTITDLCPPAGCAAALAICGRARPILQLGVARARDGERLVG
jgi:4'-phosphopantetheinyl transferase